MAENSPASSPPSLCYYCMSHLLQKTCLADDTEDYYDVKEQETAKAYWQLISEQVIKEKNRAQQLASKLSSKVLEIVKFCGNSFADFPIDLNERQNIQVDMFAMPESVRMCENCCCFCSIQPQCHCEECMGEGYRPHYVILMHGVVAEPFQMACVAQYLLRAFPHIFIYFPHNVAGKSLLGLDLVLEMFSSEILTLFDKVADKIKISLIGHSFGGVILRYWMLFYYKKTPGVYYKVEQGSTGSEGEQQPRATEEGKHRELEIEWSNYISIATPHSGIYENHVAFRKLVSLIGSKSVDQLDNESVDLLLLVSKEARESMTLFENVVVYGNLWGDMLVAPRTSILLPYHMVGSDIMDHFIKMGEHSPGMPQHVCDMLTNYMPPYDPKEAEAGNDEDNPLEARNEKMVKLSQSFFATAAEKIRSTSHIQKLLRKGSTGRLDGPDKQVFLQVFPPEDLEYFTLIISKIVDRADKKLLKRMYEHPKLLYNEVMLSGLWDMTLHKFAVYLPTMCMPHQSIVTLGELDSWHRYTKKILAHVTYMFVV